MRSAIEQRTFDDPWQDWLTSDVYNRLHFRAERRFPNDILLAEEAFNYALEGLAENNWRRLRAYRGDSSPATFLFVIFTRLLEDFHINRFGRTRPPVLVSRLLGSLGEEIFDLLCMRRWPSETVVEYLSAGRGWEVEAVRKTIHKLKALVPNCGAKLVTNRLEFSGTVEPIDITSTPDQLCQRTLMELWCCLVNHVLNEDSQVVTHTPELLDDDWLRLCKDLQLDNLERRIITLRYLDGRSFGFIARIEARLSGNEIGIRSLETRLRRKHDRVLKRWREVLELYGLEAAPKERIFLASLVGS